MTVDATIRQIGQVARKLKVYRTPIGFHDAYVAAPSQKAALEAWGSEHNLFARGAAELVTDPALTEEPLAQPGEVVRRLRGSAAEQIAALPPDKKPKRARKESAAKARSPAPPPKAKRVPPPSRSELEAAEQALVETEKRHRAEEKELAEREAQLARERKALDRMHAAEVERLQRALEAAKRAYERAVETWRG